MRTGCSTGRAIHSSAARLPCPNRGCVLLRTRNEKILSRLSSFHVRNQAAPSQGPSQAQHPGALSTRKGWTRLDWMILKASPQPSPFCNPVVLTHLGSGVQLPPGKQVAVQVSSKGIISLSSSW